MSSTTDAQQRSFASAIQNTPGYGILLCEFNSPAPQTLSVHAGGQDLTAFLTEVRAIATRAGRAWTTDAAATRGDKVETGADVRARRGS